MSKQKRGVFSSIIETWRRFGAEIAAIFVITNNLPNKGKKKRK